MTKNSGNQIKNKMIASYPKTDREKLAGLERHIHENYTDIGVTLESFMAFTKGESEYMGCYSNMSKSLVKLYDVHPPDMLLRRPLHDIIVVELDGPIHDIKTEKTEKRNKRYDLNNIPYIVINEAELKLKLGIPKSRKLTQEQINAEFDERLNYTWGNID